MYTPEQKKKKKKKKEYDRQAPGNPSGTQLLRMPAYLRSEPTYLLPPQPNTTQIRPARGFSVLSYVMNEEKVAFSVLVTSWWNIGVNVESMMVR